MPPSVAKTQPKIVMQAARMGGRSTRTESPRLFNQHCPATDRRGPDVAEPSCFSPTVASDYDDAWTQC